MVLYSEREKDGIGISFYLTHDHRPGDAYDSDDRFVTHGLASVTHKLHVGLVGSRNCLPLVGAVGKSLERITSCNAGFTSVFGCVIFVLETDRDVAVATLFTVSHTVTAAGSRSIDENYREISLPGIIYLLIILVHHCIRNRIDPASLGGLTAEHASTGFLVVLGNIYLEPVLLRQDVTMVLQHYNGLELSLVTGSHEFRVPYDLLSLGGIQVWILKQAGAETVEEKTYGRCLETLTGTGLSIFLDPHIVSVEDRALLIVASELVDSGLDGFEVTLRLGEGLHPPTLPFKALDMCIILGYVPVCTDYPFEAISVTEKIGDYVFVVAVSCIGSRRILVPGDGVVRHDG